jgi:hypothetical protein
MMATTNATGMVGTVQAKRSRKDTVEFLPAGYATARVRSDVDKAVDPRQLTRSPGPTQGL